MTLLDAPELEPELFERALQRHDSLVLTYSPRAARGTHENLVAILLTVLTLGLAFPSALVRVERARAAASSIDGHPLAFTGTAADLYPRWLVWLPLTLLTAGLSAAWWLPRLHQWRWENLRVVE